MKEFIHNVATILKPDLEEKFRADVKVLFLFQSCWGISNRRQKNFENYGNAADELFFKMGRGSSPDSDAESSKRRFLLHCSKKQHFLVKK